MSLDRDTQRAEMEKRAAEDAAYDAARERARRYKGGAAVLVICNLPGHRENAIVARAWVNPSLRSVYCESMLPEFASSRDRQEILGWERRNTTSGKRAPLSLTPKPYLLAGAPGAIDIPSIDAWCPRHGPTLIPADAIRDAVRTDGRKPATVLHPST